MKITVIGRGLMGKGISGILRTNGHEVDNVSARGMIEGESSITASIQSSQCVIECAQEDLFVKETIIRLINNINPDIYIGTCTSSFSISKLQKFVLDSSKFCGVHFMNPPRAIVEVELIAGDGTSDETLKFFTDLLTQIGNSATIVPDTPGFIINSILFALLNKAAYVLDETRMEAQKVDELMIGVCGFKIGPLATLDLIGIDTALNILNNLHAADPATNLPPANILISMNESGRLGRKAKHGFYNY